MNITIIGTGYVGLSTGVTLADVGHKVTCVDIDEEKIKMLNNGISPIYEPGIEELIISNLFNGNVSFSKPSSKIYEQSDIIIIAVGTPQDEQGQADLTFLKNAAIDVAKCLKNHTIIVIKSTVPVGTNDYVKQIIKEYKDPSATFDMISNPEFLREGSAISDTKYADRIVIGYDNIQAASVIQEMYSAFQVPFILTSIRSAEMIKYASNSFLATKISFINEIANLCEKVGADILDVAKGMGLDKRIGAAFLQAGIGYGGSCFPKDVKAFIQTCNQFGIDFKILNETIAINNKQQQLLVDKALHRFNDIKDKKFAILGLAFKPNTDDMREAPSIRIIRSLQKLGAKIAAFDPIATKNAKHIFGEAIEYYDSITSTVRGADAIFIVTEWDEIKNMNLDEVMNELKEPIIFDGRNCIPVEKIYNCDEIEYYSVGRAPIIKRTHSTRATT